MNRIDVVCSTSGDGATCQVTVKDDRSESKHVVHVPKNDLQRWGRGGSPEDLVRRSFEFLLQREPKESILREFELSIIQRYFPEFDRKIVNQD